MMMSRIKYQLLNSSIHGLRYTAEPKLHVTERLFWTCAVTLAWVGSVWLVISACESFSQNSISFTVDTSSLEWNTDFPSVTFCEKSSSRIKEIVQRKLPQLNYTDFNVVRMVSDLVFYKEGSTTYENICFMPGKAEYKQDVACPRSNLSSIAKQFRSPCSDIFVSCKWNDKDMGDCCKYFLPLETEFGLCYSINNIQSQKRSRHPRKFSFMSNRTTGTGSLHLEMKVAGELFWHGNADIPNHNSQNKLEMKLKKFYPIYFRLVPTITEPEVKGVAISKRSCRFPDENPLPSFRFYSKSACVVECRKREQRKLCSCASFVMPGLREGEECELNQLKCLAATYANLSVLKSERSKAAGIYCPCDDSCDSLDITTQIIIPRGGFKKGKTGAGLMLERLPVMRYKRSVARTLLDLVVSVGGTAALFSGASFLSFVETIYLIFLRTQTKQRGHRDDSSEHDQVLPSTHTKHTQREYHDDIPDRDHVFPRTQGKHTQRGHRDDMDHDRRKRLVRGQLYNQWF